MTKQMHIRLDDRIYSNLSEYAAIANKPMNDCVMEALSLYFDEKMRERKRKDAKFKFIDLFAGIGGIRLAFEAHGGDCVFSSEWDRYCQRTYFENFGVMPHGDIKAINEQDIPDHDILTAGFPCQPFSIAGVSKKNSLGRDTGFLDKTQGTLFFDVARIIKAKRPKIFLLENVKNLKSHDKGKTWEVITATLDELGYMVFSEVIDGQIFSPQHRERIFIVGFDRECYKDGIEFDFTIAQNNINPRLKDILEDSVDSKYTLTDHLWQYLQDYAAKHRAKGNGFGYGLADLDGVTRTLSARYYKDGSEILIPQVGKNPTVIPRGSAPDCKATQMIF